MKFEEMRDLTIEELNNEVISNRKRLFELRMAKAMHKLENTAEIGTVKNFIAQLKTVIREKQLQK